MTYRGARVLVLFAFVVGGAAAFFGVATCAAELLRLVITQ